MGSQSSKKGGKVVKCQNINKKITSKSFIQKVATPFDQVYKIGKKLGNGTFGEVRAVTHLETQIQRAVKIFRKSSFSSKNLEYQLYSEIEILKSLDHPNIIRFIEYFEDDKKIYLILEKCEGGELYSQILKINCLSEDLSASLMKQIISAVNYLHQKKIVHRDLKPENILFEYKNDLSSIKIIDFGLAHQTKEKRLKEKVGSIFYISPEVLNMNYSEKCDMWSCGVIAFVMLSGVPPFDGSSNAEISEKIMRLSFSFNQPVWKIHSAEARDFISKLLCPESRRMSAQEALSHPWICNIEIPSPCKEIFQPVLRSLREFHCTNKLKEAVFAYIVSQCVTHQDTQELKKVFMRIDKDGDGKISSEELLAYYRKIMGGEFNEEDVFEIMNRIDSDATGFIDYSQFISACLARKMANDAGYLKMAFKKFDCFGNGKFSLNEIKSILEQGQVFDEETWKEIFHVQGSKDIREIDYQQFSKMVLA
jgi:calcium-dependent protein kinase